MYTPEMMESIKKVEATRAARIETLVPRMTAAEKEKLLNDYHPDYKDVGFGHLKIGPNKNKDSRTPLELIELLHARSRVEDLKIDLSVLDYDVDVLVIGGGGSGASAAIEAHENGASVMLVTKLRVGDANTMMAEGGIQACDHVRDSPMTHFLDAYGGGHFKAQHDLLRKLVMDGPIAIKWLEKLGVMFDKEKDGTMITTHGGGTSVKRMHAAADYSGAEIMRVVRDELFNRKVPVMDFTAALEILLDDKGNAAGAIVQNMETQENFVIRAKTVIIATGGSGRIHYQGFPTSNHYGATADGLVLGYRVGAKLLYHDALQIHPTGVAFPPQIYGALITEKTRAVGALFANVNGESFVHPLETRDVASAAVIRECGERGNGIKVGDVMGLWLDSPVIEIVNGPGTIEKRIPGMMRMYGKYDIDIRKVPMFIYPTFHYQNGGLEINVDCQTPNVKNLYVAGEAVGGIHGRNRLMGNSLLDIIVFGRSAGKNASEASKSIPTPKGLNLGHLKSYAKELKDAGIEPNAPSPMLLPPYAEKARARR